MRLNYRTERIRYHRGLSWRIEIKFWTNHDCKKCWELNEENPVDNRLFHTYSRREYRKHLKSHKEQK